MYTKVRGHHCWWLYRNGTAIALFDINGLISDEQAESYVDEIIDIEKRLNQKEFQDEASGD